MKVTVYLGANMGDNPSFKKATIALGQWIAKNGHTLVYGGSRMGLMGVLGDTVLENGGQAHGIMPQFLKDREIAYEGLTSMTIVRNYGRTKDCHARARRSLYRPSRRFRDTGRNL